MRLTNQSLAPLLLALVALQGAQALTHSCEEVKNHLVNNLDHAYNSNYACVVVQEGFTDWAQLALLAVVDGTDVHYFDQIANSTTLCVSKRPTELWRVTGLEGLQKGCPQEFTLLFTSSLNSGIVRPVKEVNSLDLNHITVTLVVPQTGIQIRTKHCEGGAVVTIYNGIGNDVGEGKFKLGSWSCDFMPQYILSFDTVLTIESDTRSYAFEFTSDVSSKVPASLGDTIIISTNGKSDDLQNLDGGLNHEARIEIDNAERTKVEAKMQLQFDAKNLGGAIMLHKALDSPEYDFFYNGSTVEQFKTGYFELTYLPRRKEAADIGSSNDNILIEITIDSDDTYCDCSVSKKGAAVGWNSTDIWLDIVVVLDASEAMGTESLESARKLTESFISDGVTDFLITDPSASFYTRIGVISMGETAEVLYNLNMTKADKIQASIKQGLASIDINKAFDAASNMLAEGVKSNPDRANARQVIYYMTDSLPRITQPSIDAFKTAGVIMVNQFVKEGHQIPSADLKELASDGYYYTSTNYQAELQSFCKANCFCRSGRSAAADLDPALQASGGCLAPVKAGAPFSKAKAACAENGGILATIHDDQKAQVVTDLLSDARLSYFWIGYERLTLGQWTWEDQSTDPYTNWDNNEPSSSSAANCAYVDTTNYKLPWGSGNCQIAFPYACQYAPCTAGNKNC